MEQYAEDTGYGKKRLLIPLLVLMLCAVSVIGTGYAFSSQLTLDDNGIEEVGVRVTYGGTDAPTAGADTIIVYSNETWGTDGTYKMTSEEVKVASSGTDPSKAKLAVAPVKFKLEDADRYTSTSVLVTLTLSGTNVADVEKMISSFEVNGVQMVKKSSGNYEATVPLDSALSTGETAVTYTLTAGLAGEIEGLTYDAAVSALRTTLFDLKFSAEIVPASP